MNSKHRAVIMANAWKMAKAAVKKFGGKAVEYLAESLRIAWSGYKAAKQAFEAKLALKANSVKVAPWFVKKNDEMRVMYNENANVVVKETEKAILLDLVPNLKQGETPCQVWVPKSCIIK